MGMLCRLLVQAWVSSLALLGGKPGTTWPTWGLAGPEQNEMLTSSLMQAWGYPRIRQSSKSCTTHLGAAICSKLLRLRPPELGVAGRTGTGTASHRHSYHPALFPPVAAASLAPAGRDLPRG